MKRANAILFLLSAALLTFVPLTVEGQKADDRPMGDRPVRALSALRKERIDTLRHLVDSARARFQAGHVHFDTVARAENRLSEAQLEYAKTKEERVRILRERVRMFRAVEFTQKDPCAS